MYKNLKYPHKNPFSEVGRSVPPLSFSAQCQPAGLDQASGPGAQDPQDHARLQNGQTQQGAARHHQPENHGSRRPCGRDCKRAFVNTRQREKSLIYNTTVRDSTG